MSEFRTITADTYKKDDVLVNRTDSTRTARVVEAIKRDNKFTGFLVVFNNGKQGKLSKFDLEKDSCPWVLRGTPIEPAFEYDAKDVEIMKKESEELAESLNPVPVIKEPEYDADKAERDHLTSEAYGSDDDSVVETVAAADPDSDPQWNEVEQLRKELEAANNLLVSKDNKITELRATLDNLIDAQSPSAEHSVAQDDRNDELQEQVNELRTDLEKAYQLVAERNMTNKELTQQLAQVSAELALSKVPAELKPVAAADAAASTELKQDIFTLVQNMGMNTRIDSDKAFAKQLNEGWQPIDISVTSGVDYVIRVVTFTRYIPATPATPEPRKAVEAIPGTHIVIQPVEAAPVERFNANEYMEEALTQSMNAANQAVIDRLPIYQQITNRPLGLPPVKPTARVS